jgi:hypothetical protein
LANADADGANNANSLPYVDFAGRTLEPGSYVADAAMGLTGTLRLSTHATTVGAVTDPEWTIYIGGALTTGEDSKIVIIGASDQDVIFDPLTTGALPASWENKVHFKVIGAITVGVNSNMWGDLKAGGAIVVGESATVGNLQAGGAVTLGPAVTAGTIRDDGALSMDAPSSNDGIYDATKQPVPAAGACA